MKPVDSAADLLRLSDRSGSDLASALRELSARGPDATELASLATRLSLQGIAMAPPATAAPAVGAARGAAWKLALVGTAALAGVAWWALQRGPTAPSAPQAGATRGAAALAVASALGGPAAARLAPSDRKPAAVSAPLAASAPSASVASPSPTPGSSPSLQTSPAAPPAREAATTLSPPAEPSPHREGPVRGTSSASDRPTTNGAEAAAADPALPSELELLRGARLALKGSPAQALLFVEQHRASYPAGKLTQERELIAISALLALGRRTAALSRAAKFEQAFPSSPYRKQIGELLQ